MKKIFYSFLAAFTLLMSVHQAVGQSNPTAQSIPYSQNFSTFNGTGSAGYPAGWQGWTLSATLSATPSTAAATGNSTLSGGTNATTTAGVYDMNGKIAVQSTGSNLAFICLALNTTSLTGITISYTAATQQQATGGRVDILTAQYRVGTSGAFTAVPGNTSEYHNTGTSTNSSGTTGVNPATISLTLPAACEGQSNVQVRWVINDSTGSGTRPNFSITNLSVTGTAAATPTMALSSPSQITAGNVSQGSADQPISNFQATVGTAAATLSTLSFATGGTYSAADLTNFKLWYNGTANTFAGASQIGTTVTSIPATGGTVTFSSIGGGVAIGTGYFWITASVAASGTLTKTFSAGSPTLTFVSGTPTGSVSAGGAQTISTAANYYWNGNNTSTLNGAWDNTTLNWSTPTAAPTLNAAWPTQLAVANFNATGGGNVFLPSSLVSNPVSINIGSNGYYFTHNSASSLTAPINLGSNTLTLAPVVSLALSSVISGTGSMSYVGGGTTTIAATTGNKYSGGTSITAGVLIVAADSNLGAVPATATPGNIIIDGGARLTTTPGFVINANRGIQFGANAANSISVTGSGISTYNGIMADLPSSTPGTWAKQGGGTLILGGHSTYTGPTSVNNGIVQITTSNVLPSASVVTMGQAASSNIGTLDLNGNNQTIDGISSNTGTNSSGSKNTITTSTGTATLTLTGSDANSYGSSSAANSGVITGAVSLVMNGAGGVQTLGDANTYTGSTTVTSGALLINGSTASASAVSVGTAGTLGGSGTAAGTVSMSGTLSPGASAGTAGALTTGAFTFAANSTYKFEVSTASASAGVGYDELISTGAITCSASPIIIDITSIAGAGFSYTTTYNWTIASGSSISGFSAANFSLHTANFSPALNGGVFSILQSGNNIILKFTPSVPSLTPTPAILTGLTYIAGSGPSAASSFTLSGLNLTPGGGTIIIAGTTDYEVSTASATTGFGSTAILTYTGTGTISPNTVYVRLKSGLAVASYNSEVINITGGGVTSGSPATVTVSGSVTPAPVTYYWNGNNTTALNATWDNVTNNWSAPSAGSTLNAAWPTTGTTNTANFSATGGGIVTLPGTIAVTPLNTVIGASGYTFAATSGTLGGPIALGNDTLGLSPTGSSGALALTGVISGPGSLEHTGAGNTTISGTNTYTGHTIITNGAVIVNTDAALGAVPSSFAANNIVINGGRLTTTPGFTINPNRGIQLGATTGTSISVTGSGTATYNGIMSDMPSASGSWAKQGGGTLKLGGANTYSGATICSNGIVQITAPNVLPATTILEMGQAGSSNTGNFDLAGNNQTIAGITSLIGSGTTSNNSITTSTTAATLRLTGSGNYSYGDIGNSSANTGKITGAVSLVVAMPGGSQTLAGNNTYTGTTSIDSGTLFVNNGTGSGGGALSASSAVTVLSTGTLAGNGKAAGTVSLSGTVSPGIIAASTGTLTTGALTFNANSIYKFEMNNATGTAGTTSGWDEIVSTGAITCSASPILIDLTSLSVANFAYTSNYSWTIATGTSISGFGAANFTVLTSNFVTTNGGTFAVAQSGNNINLVYTAPPLTCTGSNGGHVTANTPAFCTSGSTILSDVGYSTGPTIVYQWQKSTDRFASNIVNITGQSNPDSLNTGTITSTTYYRLQVTCTALSLTGYSNIDSVVVSSTCAITWAGAASTDWGTATNWSPAVVPNSCTWDVVIPAGSANHPVISTTDIQIGNLTLGNNQSITLTGHNLSICKNLTGPASTATAAHVSGSGKLILDGTAAQTISSFLYADEILVNNSTDVTVVGNHPVYIYRGLSLQSGVLNVTAANSASLTLLSNNIDTVAWLNDFTSGYTGSITGGGLTVQRQMAVTGTAWQHQVSSPVTGIAATYYAIGQSTYGWAAGQYLTPSSNCSEDSLSARSAYSTGLTWHEANVTTCVTTGWKTVGANDLWLEGQGTSLYLTSGSKIALTGNPGTGNVNVSGLTNSNWVDVTPEGHTFNSGWALLGNPYPSSVDLTTTRLAAGFDAQVQVYEPAGQFSGTYQQYLIGTTTPHLSAFQGFMIHKSATGGTSTWPFYQAERTTSQGPTYQFWKDATPNNLALTVSGNGFADITRLSFNSQATDGFDPEFDANKFHSRAGQPTLYTTIAGESTWIGINTMNALTAGTTVPVGFEAGADGTFAISVSADDLASFDPSIAVYLEDMQNPKWIDLRATNTYSFTAKAADNTNRFKLHFTEPSGIAEVATNANVNIFASNGNVVVDFSKLPSVDATIQIYNILGQELSNETHHVSDTYVKPIASAEASYVVVRVKMADGSIIGKKLFVTK